MLSCDTIAVAAAFSKNKKNLFAKNSDRPTGEPQPLCFYPGAEYEDGATLTVTHQTIPQVKKTYAVVGSRPYWIWGFEMGYNEKGLVIGNEAEGSRMGEDPDDGMLGMDMLRLALERAENARRGISVIGELLKTHGQKAQASALVKKHYENTFILVDPKEAWVMETAGREWVAKKITKMQGISNCYSIRTDFDLASENLEKIARDNRWLSPNEAFDFAKAYSGRLLAQPLGVQRYRRLNQLLAKKRKHDFNSLSAILRDHFDGEITEPRFGDTTGTFMSVCMHMRDWGESETSASLLLTYDDALGFVARYAPVQPCLSAYIPVYMTDLPRKMQYAEKEYSAESLWWQVKEMSLLITVDEEAYAPGIRQELAVLETVFNDKAKETEKEAKKLICAGKKEEANKLLSDLTVECTDILFDFAKERNQMLRDAIRQKGGFYGRQKEAIEKYFEYANIPVL